MEIVHGGPTKPEIAAIAMAKLKLSDTDTFADIGCGTGKISLMAARLVRHVYAIDARGEAVTASRKNFHEIHNIELIQGEAPQVLEKLPLLNCAFVGGTRNIEETLHMLREKVRGRIVVNAVRIHTVSTIIRTMQQLDIFREAVLVQVSRSYPLAGDIIFKPLNPVYIIVGDIDDHEEDD